MTNLIIDGLKASENTDVELFFFFKENKVLSLKQTSIVLGMKEKSH